MMAQANEHMIDAINENLRLRESDPFAPTYSFDVTIDVGDGIGLADGLGMVRHTLGMLSYLDDGVRVVPCYGTFGNVWQTGVTITSQTYRFAEIVRAVVHVAMSVGAEWVHTTVTYDRGETLTSHWNAIKDQTGETIRR